MYPALLNQSVPQQDGGTMPPSTGMPMQQTQAQQPAPMAFAHGGHVGTKRGKMVMAHFNKHELNDLDHLQGKVEKCPRTGMRSYSHLEEILKNPHILANVHHHTNEHHRAMGGSLGGMPMQHYAEGGSLGGMPMQHYAEGGSPSHGGMPMMHYSHGGHATGGHENYHNSHLNHMAREGTHGDTELALIGPHTHHVFNQLATGGCVTNPHTGHPQYWSLGGLLGGLGSAVKGGAAALGRGAMAAGRAAATHGAALGRGAMNAARAAAPAVGAFGKAALPYAMEALKPQLAKLGNAGGVNLGELAHAGIGAIGDTAFDKMSGPGGPMDNPNAHAMGSGFGRALEAKTQGGNWGESVGQGLHHAGSQMEGSRGAALRGTGMGLASGEGIGKSLAGGAANVLANKMGMPSEANGQEGLAKAAQAIAAQRSQYQPEQQQIPQMSQADYDDL